MQEKPVAVVTGGNRGMGRALCAALAEHGFGVVLTSRNAEKGRQAVAELNAEGHLIEYTQLDVTNAAHIAALAEDCKSRLGRVDVLINNAGILAHDLSQPVSIFDDDAASISNTFVTNTLAPIMLTNALIPLMRTRNYGRIVNVSSGMGQLSDMGSYHAGYRISKTALNSATTICAAELAGSNIKVNAVSPGWVRTDMGGSNASRSVAEGIDTMLWLAMLPDDGPSGGFFQDRQPIPW